MNRRSFLTTLLGAVCGAAAAIYQPKLVKAPETKTLVDWASKDPFERIRDEFERELFYGSQDLATGFTGLRPRYGSGPGEDALRMVNALPEVKWREPTPEEVRYESAMARIFRETERLL